MLGLQLKLSLRFHVQFCCQHLILCCRGGHNDCNCVGMKSHAGQDNLTQCFLSYFSTLINDKADQMAAFIEGRTSRVAMAYPNRSNLTVPRRAKGLIRCTISCQLYGPTEMPTTSCRHARRHLHASLGKLTQAAEANIESQDQLPLCCIWSHRLEKKRKWASRDLSPICWLGLQRDCTDTRWLDVNLMTFSYKSILDACKHIPCMLLFSNLFFQTRSILKG